MSEQRTQEYARRLSRLIQVQTVSSGGRGDADVFACFRTLLRREFPAIFEACTYEEFGGSILMRWPGSGGGEPILLMNHHDVVEATGEWSHPPFAGEVADGKIWGRGVLDNKGGLWAMFQAADELASDGFVPGRDIYLMSTCDEECGLGSAGEIARVLQQRGVRLAMVLDEGGMILEDPIDGTRGFFAMVGVGEKGCADLKFIARSAGGHASIPGKNTPLVRLGRFMAQVERGRLFPAKLSPTVCAMFASLSTAMHGPMKLIMGHARLFAPLLVRLMPTVSAAAGAMLKTTVAFTMAGGSEGANVLPGQAWVVGNMRYSHHQGGRASIEAITRLAEKYGIETQVLDPGEDSPLSDHRSGEFASLARAVERVFPGVKVSPYVMTGASDCRYMSLVSDNCLRFTPFAINKKQLGSIHGVDENLDRAALVPAVEFYKQILTEE